MAVTLPIGFDFRATLTPSGFGGDPPNCVPELSTTADYTSAQGYGFELAPSGHLNGAGTPDPRIQGSAYWTNPGLSVINFRVDLPAAGTYPITLALGDITNAQKQYAAIYDDTTLLAVVAAGVVTSGGRFLDASGNDWTTATWPGSNVPRSLTFTSTILRVQLGTATGGTSHTTLAHLFVGAGSGGGVTGTLAVTQADQTFSGAATVTVSGALAATQAAQTIAATGAVAVSGSLAATQAGQTLSGAALVGVDGALAVTQASQTLAAAAAVKVTGTLAVAQAAQTLSAAGSVGITGALAVTQASQTLVATGTVSGTGVTGALSLTQAAQTISAAGAVTVSGGLTATQAAQTLSASGIAGASTFVFNQTLPDVAGSIDFATGNGFSFTQILALGPSGFRVSGNVGAAVLNMGFPAVNVPMVDPTTGIVNPAWHRLLVSLWTRTGGNQGGLSR